MRRMPGADAYRPPPRPGDADAVRAEEAPTRVSTGNQPLRTDSSKSGPSMSDSNSTDSSNEEGPRLSAGDHDEDVMALSSTGAIPPPAEGGVALHVSDGLDGIGRAVAAVSLSGDSLPAAQPSVNMDLRKFIRAGDILNYLGGNIWGHTVMVLATPHAVEVAHLYDKSDKENPELRELARRVPVYVAKVLQSASNMLDIGISACAMVVHPVTQEVCPVKQLSGSAVQLCAGKETHVSMELFMSPLNNKTLDFDLFVLSVEECHRMPQDTKWSLRTAVRSYLRKAELNPSKYKSDRRKVKLARELSATWRKRPICSTIPPRVWQKYLLKVSYQSGVANPEAAWAGSVLETMPVKDDRVLPSDLVKALTGTGRWSRLDFVGGPPAHRLADADVPGPEHYNAKWTPRPRAKLQPGQRNPDGAEVWLGQNRFNLYCGRQISKPQKIEHRMGHHVKPGQQIEWDGKCGADGMGPQCDACRWLEDRLDFKSSALACSPATAK